MIGILYNHLVYVTTMEVFGEIAEGGIGRIATLRSLLGKLLKKYDLVKTLPPDAFLILGLTEFLTREQIEAWSTGVNAHLKKRAEYFLKLQKS